MTEPPDFEVTVKMTSVTTTYSQRGRSRTRRSLPPLPTSRSSALSHLSTSLSDLNNTTSSTRSTSSTSRRSLPPPDYSNSAARTSSYMSRSASNISRRSLPPPDTGTSRSTSSSYRRSLPPQQYNQTSEKYYSTYLQIPRNSLTGCTTILPNSSSSAPTSRRNSTTKIKSEKFLSNSPTIFPNAMTIPCTRVSNKEKARDYHPEKFLVKDESPLFKTVHNKGKFHKILNIYIYLFVKV